MIRLAGLVDLSRSNARQANFRTFFAPDRAVAIPHPHWSAAKALPTWNNRCEKKCDQQLRISLAWRDELGGFVNRIDVQN